MKLQQYNKYAWKLKQYYIAWLTGYYIIKDTLRWLFIEADKCGCKKLKNKQVDSIVLNKIYCIIWYLPPIIFVKGTCQMSSYYSNIILEAKNRINEWQCIEYKVRNYITLYQTYSLLYVYDIFRQLAITVP